MLWALTFNLVEVRFIELSSLLSRLKKTFLLAQLQISDVHFTNSFVVLLINHWCLRAQLRFFFHRAHVNESVFTLIIYSAHRSTYGSRTRDLLQLGLIQPFIVPRL